MVSAIFLFALSIVNAMLVESLIPPRRNCLTLWYTGRMVNSSSTTMRLPQQFNIENTSLRSLGGFQTASPGNTLKASRSSCTVNGRVTSIKPVKDEVRFAVRGKGALEQVI
ncbi:hypothetical protein K469DRAFT_681379 [Zopfia rhizophila CBS 207.26]|uniref:Secreted protein n=1 Tax=Zopfia rhizophila CBS 207.26 TaxID=1314779 RepID=A0A6A6EUX7_9PEZI|nr:hypothetical protein K469DRAFT_681379 [Zopfia rhizophila CBS 207.26]